MNKNYIIKNYERELWINNDESLYNWFKSSKKCLTKFIKENKEQIDSIILKKLDKSFELDKL